MRSGAIFRQVGLISNIHRFIVGGVKNDIGYTAKFVAQSISSNSDFSSGSWSMTALSAGTDDITAVSGVTIAAVGASFTPVAGTYSNQTFTYILISSTKSDVYFQLADQSFSVTESSTSSCTPDLPCSSSGTTAITYTIADFRSTTAPSWVSINSDTGALSITPPVVNANTEYNFYINSAVTGFSDPFQKKIKFTVMNCVISNCETCTTSSASICQI